MLQLCLGRHDDYACLMYGSVPCRVDSVEGFLELSLVPWHSAIPLELISVWFAGMVKIALNIIDAWMTHYSKAKLGDQEVPSPVPRYMDALLLIVNSSTAVIWKPQAAESAAGKPAAKEPQVRLNSCPLHKIRIGTRVIVNSLQ